MKPSKQVDGEIEMYILSHTISAPMESTPSSVIGVSVVFLCTNKLG
jgi:hypothetical protein